MSKEIFSLLVPDTWMGTPLGDILAKMADANAGSVSFATAAPGKNLDFAVVLLQGDGTPEILEAVSAATDAQRDASDPAGALARIRGVMKRHLHPMGTSKHEAIAEIAAILAQADGIPSRLEKQEQGVEVENGKG